MLYVSGAAGASVYASAVAASASPDDLQVASNLSVALDTIADAKSATAVLLYARRLAPQQALPTLNLAWVYFNSGHAAEAKTQLQNAASLYHDLSCPPAGLGMLASCKGDTATALAQFRKSLSKSFSGVVAAGYTNAQEAQQEQQQQQNSSPPAFLSSQRQRRFQPPSRSTGHRRSSDHTDFGASLSARSGLRRQGNTGRDGPSPGCASPGQAIGRLAQIDPDGNINLPRVFDKQLFEYPSVTPISKVSFGK